MSQTSSYLLLKISFIPPILGLPTDSSAASVVPLLCIVFISLLVYTLFRVDRYCHFGPKFNTTLDFSNIQPLQDFNHTKIQPRVYLPWKAGKYNMTMGIRKMPEDDWLVIDQMYEQEQKFKECLIGKDLNAVLQYLPGSHEACKETLECVVGFLTRRYPDHFIEKQPGYIYNAITKRKFRIVEPFEQHPLAIAAQLAMEDFNMLIRGPDGSQDYHLYVIIYNMSIVIY